MEGVKITALTPDNISDYGVCGYKDAKKHVELQKKIFWYSQYYPKGLRIKAVFPKTGEYQGMIEYIPGEYAHRPVYAARYMFIHCLFVGFKKQYKGQGLASALINECLADAKKLKMDGAAVVTRKGSFMADSRIFLKHGFAPVGSAPPDFELLAKKFSPKAKNPAFKPGMEESLKKYAKGLTILRSAQCPYTEKNVNAIIKSAKEKYKVRTTLVELKTAGDAGSSPCAFGTFCIVYNGKIISHHPISATRFENIMNKQA